MNRLTNWVQRSRSAMLGLGLAVVVCGVVASSSVASSVIPLTVAQLTGQADRIYIGDVIGVRSAWIEDEAGRRIMTQVLVRPVDVLKGEPAAVELLNFHGGEVGEYWSIRTDTPWFETGMRVVLFLDSENLLVGAYQGAYLTDGEIAVRMSMPLDPVSAAHALPLELLVARIVRALGGTELPPLTPYEGDYEIPWGQRFATLGFDWLQYCNPMGEPYRINPNATAASAGSQANQIAAIQAGANVWADAEAGFAFSYGGTTSVTSAADDGINAVFFCPSGNCGMNSNTIAVTSLAGINNNIVEWDMIFNQQNHIFWDGQTGSCSGMKDIQAVAAHEFGHALGLDHSAISAATMFASISNCSTSQRSLHSDDVAGVAAIYDNAPVNDHCEDAIEIFNGATAYTTVGACTSGPSHAACNQFGFDTIERDVWFTYQATCSGNLTVSTCNTAAYDTKLAVYAGTDCSALNATILGCNDDAAGCGGNTSRLTVSVVAGQCYLIRIGGYLGSSGSGTVTLTCVGVRGGDCEGDANGDGLVNVQDLLLVIANWGTICETGCGAPDCDGDVNSDGAVNVQDLLAVIANWGNDCN